MRSIREALRNFFTKNQRLEYERTEVFFDRITKILIEFADEHLLKFEKQSHGLSKAFLFRNPKGGYSGMQLFKVSQDSMKMKISWHRSDIDSMKVWNRIEEVGPFVLEAGKLKTVLEENLKKVLSWNEADLIDVQKIQKLNFSKEEEKKIQTEFEEKLPFPKI